MSETSQAIRTTPNSAAAVANPAPLGLAGFGLTTVLLSLINAGWLGAAAQPAVVPLAFAFGGAAQILAGLLEFRNANTFGTVAFTSYGAFWWWYAFLVWSTGAGWMKPPEAAGIGAVLLLWGVFTLYMWIPTFRLNRVLWSVFLLLWITYFLLAAGDLGAGAMWGKVGGWTGLACGLDALYLSFAEVTNATFGSVVVSTGAPLF